MIGILGPSGRLGKQLVSMGCVPITVDITDRGMSFGEEIRASDVVINCAAYTDVDKAESDDGYLQALAINYASIRYVYAACQKVGAHLIHLSSDYIFGGKYGPYSESEKIPREDDHPTTAYGLTKVAGESYILDQKDVTIVRTTGLYGGVSGRHDFLKTVLNALDTGNQFFATHELYGNQTYVPHLAEGLLRLSDLIVSKQPNLPGILNIASQDVCSRFEFARMIAKEWGYSTEKINPCKNSEVPGWVAERPTRGGLLTHLASEYGIPIHSISSGLYEAHVENRNSNSSV